MTTPLVHLSFENDSSTQAFNSGTEAHGTFVGTPVYKDISVLTRAEGNGILFDKVSAMDKIIFPSSSNFSFGSFSVSGFVKSSTGSEEDHEIILQQAYNENDYNHNGDSTGWHCRCYENYLYCRIYILGGNFTYVSASVTEDMKYNGFHYSFTYNISTRDFKIYVNGKIIEAIDGDVLVPESLSRFAIGGIFNGDNLIDYALPQKEVITDELYLFNYEISAYDVFNLYRQNKARLSAKAIILAKAKGGIPKNNIKAEANIITLLELVNATMNYRLDKGIALTDEEIERNFTFSKIFETPTPKIKDNTILNHVPSTLYFGDLTVNDIDGTFTGSGKVTALRNGYSMSQEATV